MVGIELKEFQKECVNKLLDATTNGEKRTVLLQSPTGSGKTIVLIDYIEEYLETDKNTIFIWLTPGRGNLEMQSKEKMDKYSQLNTKTLNDVLRSEFDPKDTAFLNWEAITKTGNTALKEAERKNLYERVHEAHNNGLKFIVLVDEEHYNNTSKASDLIQYINPAYIIRVSATTTANKEAKYIEIKEEDVINAGLIARALYINEGVINNSVLEDEHDYLISLALEKRHEIRKEYENKGISVNPLVIIQLPNNSDDLLKKIEDILKNKNITYENQILGIWLTDRKENIDEISKTNNHTSVLIMKEAISTGWDCPRAKILVKLRNNMSETFETQVIGRIRRMPQAKHYRNELLDNCYLYTFDEKYEQTIKETLGKAAQDVKVVFVKSEHKKFTLTKEVRNNEEDYIGDKEAFTLIYDYFKKKYNLVDSKKDNVFLLQTKGFVFGDILTSHIVQDKVTTINEISGADRINIAMQVNTHKNGIDLRHSIGVISSRVGMRYDKMRVVLERLFFKRMSFYKRFLDLKIVEFYAFIINNEEQLKYDFATAVAEENVQNNFFKEIEGIIKKELYYIPEKFLVKYDKNMRDTVIYNKSVYEEYPSSSNKSNSEKKFEKFINDNSNIKWYLKNGDKSQEYFSIIYVDNLKRRKAFYPDYILGDKNDEVWIIETKGGETVFGESKNIDENTHNKFLALRRYAKQYKLNFGFVREMDSNDNLYMCNTEYTDDMQGNNWILLDEIFVLPKFY